MKRIILAAILPFAAFGLACGVGSPGHTLTGTISVPLHGANPGPAHTGILWQSGEPCSGRGGYSDMGTGTQVVVKDGNGSVIATGHPTGGTATITDTGEEGTCIFSWNVEGVPDSDFYSVEVSHRGAITYSKADMESNNWTLALALGNP